SKHRVDRLLEEREAWLRAAITSAGDAIVVTDANGRVRLLNHSAEQITGWTQTEAENQQAQKVAQLVDSDSVESGVDPVPLALLRDSPVDFDRRCRLIARDGREMEVEGCAAPVRITDELLGAVLTFRDASARRWEERQIR